MTDPEPYTPSPVHCDDLEYIRRRLVDAKVPESLVQRLYEHIEWLGDENERVAEQRDALRDELKTRPRFMAFTSGTAGTGGGGSGNGNLSGGGGGGGGAR